MIDCIEDTGIPAAMVGLLFALPNTQLTRRLAKEGRLHENFDVRPTTPAISAPPASTSIPSGRDSRSSRTS